MGDHLHVVYGVLRYAHPALFQQAYWVFPLFAAAVGLMLASVDPMRARLARGGPGSDIQADRDPAKGGRTGVGEALVATAAFFVAYAFTAVVAELPSFVLAVLLLTWLLRVRGMPRWVVVFCVFAAVGGPLCEAALSRIGAFAYLLPDFLGIPRWLPALYLHAALAAVRIRPLTT